MILIFKRTVAEKIVGRTRRLANGLKHFCAPRQSFPTTTGGIVYIGSGQNRVQNCHLNDSMIVGFNPELEESFILDHES